MNKNEKNKNKTTKSVNKIQQKCILTPQPPLPDNMQSFITLQVPKNLHAGNLRLDAGPGHSGFL